MRVGLCRTMRSCSLEFVMLWKVDAGNYAPDHDEEMSSFALRGFRCSLAVCILVEAGLLEAAHILRATETAGDIGGTEAWLEFGGVFVPQQSAPTS